MDKSHKVVLYTSIEQEHELYILFQLFSPSYAYRFVYYIAHEIETIDNFLLAKKIWRINYKIFEGQKKKNYEKELDEWSKREKYDSKISNRVTCLIIYFGFSSKGALCWN